MLYLRIKIETLFIKLQNFKKITRSSFIYKKKIKFFKYYVEFKDVQMKQFPLSAEKVFLYCEITLIHEHF